MIKEEFYTNRIIDEILFNSNSRIVSIFKEYLIIDDFCEFTEKYFEMPDIKRNLKG